MPLPVEEHTRESVLEKVARGESLENEKLKGLDLSAANLRGADLRGAQFRYSDLRDADLRDADLRNANLRHVNLQRALLAGADLRGADFTHADIHGAVLTGARIAGAKFSSTKGLSRKVFFPQTILDDMIARGDSDLQGEDLVIPQRDERWKIETAARVVGLDAGEDTVGILHRVLTEAELVEKGLEVYRDTALIGETVYRLETGMLGTPLHERKVQMEPSEMEALFAQASAGAQPPDEEKKSDKSDQELINEFLLKRLTSS